MIVFLSWFFYGVFTGTAWVCTVEETGCAPRVGGCYHGKTTLANLKFKDNYQSTTDYNNYYAF